MVLSQKDLIFLRGVGYSDSLGIAFTDLQFFSSVYGTVDIDLFRQTCNTLQRLIDEAELSQVEVSEELVFDLIRQNEILITVIDLERMF